MKKYILLGFIIYIFLTTIFFFLLEYGVLRPAYKEYVVTITSDGFTPDELIIKKGDIVTFVNKDKDHHWPASNPHPIHDIYAQFDPKMSIEPNKSWDFQFEKLGEWRYHDHVIPYHTGVITVEPQNATIFSSLYLFDL